MFVNFDSETQEVSSYTSFPTDESSVELQNAPLRIDLRGEERLCFDGVNLFVRCDQGDLSLAELKQRHLAQDAAIEEARAAAVASAQIGEVNDLFPL